MLLDVYLDKIRRGRGLLVVVSGPSGVGKDTVVGRLLELSPGAARCVTCTTRPPRGGEVEGIDYCFVTPDRFEGMVEEGAFLEHARVHLHSYGTPAAAVERMRARGQDCVLVIDVQGGRAVRERVPDAVMVFLAPPSMEELERRLRGRGTESPEALAARLKNAQREIDCIPLYDYLVVNDEIDSAAKRVAGIIAAERARIKRYE